MRLKFTMVLAVATALLAGASGLERGTALADPGGTQVHDTGLSQVANYDGLPTGDVVVKFKSGATLGDVGDALAASDSQLVDSTAGSGLVLLDPEPGQSLDAALATLQADPDVEFAEPNRIVSVAATTPTDPYYVPLYQWSLPQIGLPEAWDVTTGNASVVIAVIDTGVDDTHEEFADGKLVAGRNFITIGINASSNASGSVKVSTTSAHPYQTGDQVVISGHSVAGYNGTKTITVPKTNISSVTNVGGAARITTSSPHGLATSDIVMIRGNSGTVVMSGVTYSINQDWVVTVNSSTTFTLNNALFGSSGTGGWAKAASWFTLNSTSYTSVGTGGTVNKPSQRDDHFHGTFVAGIAAGNTNNGVGGAGVCWSCKIMPVKVLGHTGSGTMFDVAQGIDWAVANGADVLNLSLGSGASDAGVQTAVNNAWNAGRIVVAASGNDNGPVLYPAAYANAIAVGSNDQGGAKSSFSNYGSQLDVMAPGGNVFGPDCNCNGRTGYYATGSGTSFAAPHVAGVVGLMMAAGITDKNEIVNRLTSTATDMGAAGYDTLTGWGRVNADAAIGEDTTGPTAAITMPLNGATVSGNVAIQATATDPSGMRAVRFFVDDVYIGYDPSSPFAKSWNSASVPDGPHALRIDAWDDLDNVTTTSINVTTANGGDTTGPTASITSPANGAAVSGSIDIHASATDPSGVRAVRFFVDGVYIGYDGSAPYQKTWDSGSVANGPHTLRIDAWDQLDNITVQTITVNVTNGADTTPPTVSISAPANGATITGLLTITALASDGGSGVSRVRFWIDDVYLGYDTSAPYNKQRDSATFADGSHTIKVQAQDNAGNFSGYVTINVTFNN